MLASEESPDLRLGLTHGGRARDDLGTEFEAVAKITLGEVTNGRLVNARDGAKRTGDEMKFVLNDEFRREQVTAKRLSEAGFGFVVESVFIVAFNVAE